MPAYTKWGVFAACVVFSAVGNAASVKSSSGVRRQLEDAYETAAKAFRAKDFNAILLMQTADYYHTLVDGTSRNRDQEDLATRQIAPAFKSFESFNFHINRLKVQGTRAVATTTQNYVAWIADQQNNVRKVRGVTTSRDTWVKTSQGWKLRSSEDLDEKVSYPK